MNRRGFSTMAVMMLAIIGMVLTYFMLTVVTTTLKSTSHGALKSERILDSALLYGHIDCANTYKSMVADATQPVPDIMGITTATYATYCAGDARSVRSSSLLRLKNFNNDDIGAYDSSKIQAKLGNFTYRASCGLGGVASGGVIQRCLVVQGAIPIGTNGFRKNVQLNQDYSWQTIYENETTHVPFGICCTP